MYLKSRERPADLILVQDPPNAFAYKNFESYDRWCRVEGSEPLTSEDSPGHRPFVVPYDRQAKKARKELLLEEMNEQNHEEECQKKLRGKRLAKVAFMVHMTIASWRIQEVEEPNVGKHATVRLTTSLGTIAFHNVYNHCNTIDIDGIMKELHTADELRFLGGDLNLPHEAWGGPMARSEGSVRADAVRLSEGMNDNDMICGNDPYDVNGSTFCRGKFGTGLPESVIDVWFFESQVRHLVTHEVLTTVPGFESDHRISQVSIKVDVERPVRTRYAWKFTPRVKFLQAVDAGIKELFGLPKDLLDLEDEGAAAEMVSNIISDVILPAIEKYVPIELFYEPQKQSTSSEKEPSASPQGAFREDTEVVLRNRDGLFKMVKRAKQWSAPKTMLRSPDFVVGSETLRGTPEKIESFVSAVWSDKWTKTSKSSTTISSPMASTAQPSTQPEITKQSPHEGSDYEFPRPKLKRDREQYTSPNSVSEKEVLQILGQLSLHKAVGVDGVANEALKLCRSIIAPYLTHAFNKLLALSHHPDSFKKMLIAAILKAGKAANLPKSYRPIAILNCIAKVFERVVANRFRTLVQLHPDLLPGVQFGTPGKSTTLALEHIVNFVHTNWLMGRLVSLFGLDVSGAYDNVDRKKLLEILESTKIPDWMILFVWSFLSNRRTTVRLPGETDQESEEFQINVGIPQGSPLSSILFLFYAASLIRKPMSGRSDRCVDIVAFVDDAYILISSDPPKNFRSGENRWLICRRFEEVHAELFGEAEKLQFRFSPQKTHVFHFVQPGIRGSKKYLHIRQLPQIPEFKNVSDEQLNEICPETLNILGVKFDKRLQFIDHIKEVSLCTLHGM